jgi:two-component system, NtrC family, sensor kinase
VLDTLVESATRLCDADFSLLFQREGEGFRWAASFGQAADVHERVEAYFKSRRISMDRGSITGRAALEAHVVHVSDVLADADYTWSEAQRISGYRAAIGVPLFREQTVIGVIFVAKGMPQPFTTDQIGLVTTFADQAVIAIENVRLFEEVKARTEELSESLQQQTATADVLKVISRSTFDLQTVLDTLAQSAARLCEADGGFVFRREGTQFSLVGVPSEHENYMRQHPIAPGRGTLIGRIALEQRPVHIPDVLADPEYTLVETHKLGGYRADFGVPLLREGKLIGAFSLLRSESRPFTDKQIELVTTFADQAVIAIENVRLFEEVQARTAELQESLDYQTATSDVLDVISRAPSQLQPVFDAIVETAARLCEADFATVFELGDDGRYHLTASHGYSPEYRDLLMRRPLSSSRDTAIGRMAVQCKQFKLRIRFPIHSTSSERRRNSAAIGAYSLSLCCGKAKR